MEQNWVWKLAGEILERSGLCAVGLKTSIACPSHSEFCGAKLKGGTAIQQVAQL